MKGAQRRNRRSTTTREHESGFPLPAALRRPPPTNTINPAAACGADLRRRRPPHHGGGRSCTYHTCGGRWREPSWTSPWRRSPRLRQRWDVGEALEYRFLPPPFTRGALSEAEKPAETVDFGLGSAVQPAVQAAVPTVSPTAGGAVSTTGPLSVMATVCSKWALARPSTVDWVQ